MVDRSGFWRLWPVWVCRIAPIALGGRPERLRGRTAAMWSLRGYLVVAVILLLMKTIQVGTGGP